MLSQHVLLEEIFLDDIDLNNEYFRVSKKVPIDNLARSIKNFGVIDPPLILRRNKTHTVIFGHNRIRCLRETGAAKIIARTVDELNEELYLDYIILKNYRKEIGTAGKFRTLFILKDHFKIYDARLAEIATKILGLSEDLLTEMDSFFRLPPVMLDYLDTKDIHARIMRSLLALPAEYLRLISGWLGHCMFTASSFREMVTLMADIYRRDGTSTMSAIAKNPHDHRFTEEEIIRALFEVRYPEYSTLKAKAEEIVRSLSQKCITVSYPEYFEGDHIDIILRAGKGERIQSLKKKFNDMDEGRFNELISLL